MLKPPVFTAPSSPHTTVEMNTNCDSINPEQIDDERFNNIMRKIDHGTQLAPQEIQFKSMYLEKSVRKVGDRFAEFYSKLNDEGKKVADEQISRAIEQVMLLTKIPEYQKKAPDTT